MLEVALDYYRAHHGYIMELNGLMVPANYDCDMFNDGKTWGGHRYFFAVPSRWLACYVHQAYVQSGLSLPVERPELPIVRTCHQSGREGHVGPRLAECVDSFIKSVCR